MLGAALDKCSLLSIFAESVFWGERSTFSMEHSQFNVALRCLACTVYDHDLLAYPKEVQQYSEKCSTYCAGDYHVRPKHRGKHSITLGCIII